MFAALSSIKLRKGHRNFWHEKDGIAREEVRDGHSEGLCTRRESFGFFIETGVRCFLAWRGRNGVGNLTVNINFLTDLEYVIRDHPKGLLAKKEAGAYWLFVTPSADCCNTPIYRRTSY